MNEERKQSPPEWEVKTLRELTTEFIYDLWKNTPPGGPYLPQWVLERVRELNQAAAAITPPRSPEPGPAGNGEPPGGATPAAAVVLPFPAPQRDPLPPVAARRRPWSGTRPQRPQDRPRPAPSQEKAKEAGPQ